MKRVFLITCLLLLLFSGAGPAVAAAPDTATRDKESRAVTVPAAPSRHVSGQTENSVEIWVQKHAGPWLACVIGGTYWYAKYLFGEPDWLTLRFLSAYLETSDCFYRDLEWAAEIYRKGARAGKETHALYLGHLYLKGLGVKRDVNEARRWFDLGVLYQIDADRKYQVSHTKWIMDHRGVPPELMDAIERGRKKFMGDGADILSIAKSLRFGTDGMIKNKDAAKELYSLADRALFSFTRNYRSKEPVFENAQAGFQYYKKRLETYNQVRGPENWKYEIYISLKRIYEFASSDNHGPSQKLIAEVFRKGRHVKRDFFVAYVFFRSAQNNGLQVADRIKQVRAWLSPEQIAEAEDDIRQGKIIRFDYRDIRQKKLPRKPDRVAQRAVRNTPAISSSEPVFENLEAEFQYYKTMLENSHQTRDSKQRFKEIRRSVGWIYDRASRYNHPPSQKIVGELFEAGALVEKDLLIAYFFILSAQKNGLDVTKEIE